MGESSWSRIEPEVELPANVKNIIQANVQARLNLARVIGNIVDLYLNKAGETLLELTNAINQTAILSEEKTNAPPPEPPFFQEEKI